MPGGSLPSARHTMYTVDCLCISLLEGIIRRQCQYARLPVAAKPLYQYARNGMYVRRSDIYYMDALCTTAVSYSTTMTCIRYVLRSTVLTRILRGSARSKFHTWNGITATPTRRTRLARRDNQCFDGCVPAPPYPYRYHEAPLIRCEWSDRVNRQTTSI